MIHVGSILREWDKTQKWLAKDEHCTAPEIYVDSCGRIVIGGPRSALVRGDSASARGKRCIFPKRGWNAIFGFSLVHTLLLSRSLFLYVGPVGIKKNH